MGFWASAALRGRGCGAFQEDFADVAQAVTEPLQAADRLDLADDGGGVEPAAGGGAAGALDQSEHGVVAEHVGCDAAGVGGLAAGEGDIGIAGGGAGHRFILAERGADHLSREEAKL